MVGLACVPQDLARDSPKYILNLWFAGLLRLCLEVAVFSTVILPGPSGWRRLVWKQVFSDDIALGPVGCWIRMVPMD